MGGYTKNIAVIRGIKNGFSPDGSRLTGIIKAEKYAAYLKISATLVNFAPLSAGRYIIAVSDGANAVVFEEGGFEGESAVDPSYGFGAVVCFSRGGEVSAVAKAVCGDGYGMVRHALEAAEKAERALGYNDDAVAEENYYEIDGEGDAGGGAVRENEEEESAGSAQNEDAGSVREEPQEQAVGRSGEEESQEAREIPLARDTGFFKSIEGEVQRIFNSHEREEQLERLIENSRWVKINYGDGKYYAFGVIYGQGQPEYICYGVPCADPAKPPEYLKGNAGFVPAGGGYWVMYQDARTGISIKIDNI